MRVETMIDGLDKTLRFIAGASLALVFLVILAQVAMRYLFQSVPFFMEEAARYLCTWGVFSGLTSAIIHGTHIRVGVVQQYFSRRTGSRPGLFLEFVSLCLYALVAVYGFKLVLFLHVEKSIAMGIPLSVPVAAIPVFFTFASFISIARISRAACSAGPSLPRPPFGPLFPRKRESSQANNSL